jgi:predicted dehydrogenase
VNKGSIGELRFVEVLLTLPLEIHPPDQLPWRLRPEIAGGGLFVDLASHTLDFLDFTLGPVSRVCGFARNQTGAYPAEDIVSAAFEFKNGVQVMGIWCFSSFESADRITFVGSGGKVTLSTFGTEPVQLETSGGIQAFDLPNPPHIQQPLIQQVVNELLGVGSCVSTGESGLRTNWVMDQLLKEYSP